MRLTLIFLVALGFSLSACAAPASRWTLAERDAGIVWPVDADRRLPHGVAFARGIAKTSAYCRKGVPVYRDKYGELFIYDEVFNKSKPWRLLRSPTSVYTSADGEARGLSRAAPIADFAGCGRHKLRTTLGPLDYHAGAVLRLR